MDVNQPKQEHLLALKGTDSAARRARRCHPPCRAAAAAAPPPALPSAPSLPWGRRCGALRSGLAPRAGAGSRGGGGSGARSGRETSCPFRGRGRLFPPLEKAAERGAARQERPAGGRGPRESPARTVRPAPRGRRSGSTPVSFAQGLQQLLANVFKSFPVPCCLFLFGCFFPL